MGIRKANCSSTAASDEIGCGNSGWSAPYTATASAPFLQAGQTYYVVVDSYTSSNPGGDFTLEVTLGAPTYPPTNDTCSGAIALTLGTTENGTTLLANNDFNSVSGACWGNGAGTDVVYSYTPAVDGTFTVSVAPTGVGFDAVVWVGTGTCGEPTGCVGRADAWGGSTSPEVVTVSNATAGTSYFISVDGYNTNSNGPFTIVVN